MNSRSAARRLAHASTAAAGLVALSAAWWASPAAAIAKHEAPIPAATAALMVAKDMPASAPILVRSFKKEAELEVWKRNRAGRYVLLKTFPICRWSGQLGPKRRQGDRQTPEGFYPIAKRQMNPNSAYYLSFDLGFPNAYDRAHGGTGAYLMVHGTCSSAGCYAMTDRGVGEIYGLARDAFAGGQAAFQFQAFPFRMSAANLARHRTDPNIDFWRQLKEGSDRFEATGDEPNVVVAGGRYTFAPYLDPAREALAVARRADEEAKVATLVADGIAAVRTTYSDGGQNAVFSALTRSGAFASLGDVSRPEALEVAGREVVVIPARRRPVPILVAEAKPVPLPVAAAASVPPVPSPAALSAPPPAVPLLDPERSLLAASNVTGAGAWLALAVPNMAGSVRVLPLVLASSSDGTGRR